MQNGALNFWIIIDHFGLLWLKHQYWHQLGISSTSI